MVVEVLHYLRLGLGIVAVVLEVMVSRSKIEFGW
jgi:hypothetical protein